MWRNTLLTTLACSHDHSRLSNIKSYNKPCYVSASQPNHCKFYVYKTISDLDNFYESNKDTIELINIIMDIFDEELFNGFTNIL